MHTAAAKATLTHEQIGTTRFGDPEILVTVAAPHPKAGFQLLLRSTASMPHMSAVTAATGKTSYLVYPWPEPDRAGPGHGATRDETLEGALRQIAGYVDWLWAREQVRERIEVGALNDHLERFWRGLWEDNAIDYREQWHAAMEEVARIDLIMSAHADDAGPRADTP